MTRGLVAGNWKMNGTQSALSEITAIAHEHQAAAVDVMICPPATLIRDCVRAADGTNVQIGGQDCHVAESGAHTGDISALMLADAGASAVILGHSERRADHDETSEQVRQKARAAHAAGLGAVICVGESEAQRLAENTLDIIGGQLAISVPDTSTGANTVIAYEPVWAIGTGKTPTTAQIDEVHDFMRARLCDRFGPEIGNQIRLLYGGSVKAGNAAEIFATDNVDGALVGGASLKQVDFTPIIKALEASL